MAGSLYEQIYNYMIAEIQAGRLVAGDRIPSENQLAKQFCVSRITSKRALTELARAGVVTRIRGKGSFVSTTYHPEAIQASLPLPSVVQTQPPVSVGARVPHASEAANMSALHTSAPPYSGLIGLIVPGFSDSYGTDLVQSIERYVSERGMHLVLKNSNGNLKLEQQAINACIRAGVDGLVVFPAHGEHYNSRLLRLVLDEFPLVLVDRYLRGIDACAVYSDNIGASKRLTEYLLQRGHRRIAFISPPAENTSTIEERLLGFMHAFSDHLLHLSPQLIFTDVKSAMPQNSNPNQIAHDRVAVRNFLVKNAELTAVVASEMYIAELVRDLCDELGEGGPMQLEIVCFDEYHDPFVGQRYTHIRQNQDEMGRRAVELLLAQIAHDQVPSRTTVEFEFCHLSDTHPSH